MTHSSPGSAEALQRFTEMLRLWWSFDHRQHHTHTWHSREDFITQVLPEQLALYVKRCGADAQATPEPVDITGWKLVPDDPTEQMWQAGRSADIHPGDSYSKVWRAMFEAAPDVDDCETTQRAPPQAPRTACGCTDGCEHKPGCVFEQSATAPQTPPTRGPDCACCEQQSRKDCTVPGCTMKDAAWALPAEKR